MIGKGLKREEGVIDILSEINEAILHFPFQDENLLTINIEHTGVPI